MEEESYLAHRELELVHRSMWWTRERGRPRDPGVGIWQSSHRYVIYSKFLAVRVYSTAANDLCNLA
jgi:hypothetical protein